VTEDARFRERSSIHQGALTNCDFQLNLSRNQFLTVHSLAVLAADPGLPQQGKRIINSGIIGFEVKNFQ